MTTVEHQRKRLAPYVSAKVLSEFFDHIRYVREPDEVASGLLQDYGVSPANSFALLSTLKFLGITDDTGKPTPVFRQLQVGGDEFKRVLKEIVERAYSELFSRLDVSRDTKDKVVNYFARNYSPATAERAARLFLDLCGEAGIPTASQPRQRSPKQPDNRTVLKARPLTLRNQRENAQEDQSQGREKLTQRDDGDTSKNPLLRKVQLPLSGTEWVTVEGPFPMNEQTWKQMIDMLTALKPGLVEPTQKVQEAVSHIPESKRGSRLTREAQELLDKVDEGGIPMYPTENLKKIAADNGIEATAQDTPNDIIAALRAINE